MAVQMAEYVAQAVIRFFRGLDQYEADMAQGLWQHQRNPRRWTIPWA
jgi:glyoxylate/hydroxypyruvate reductase A